MSQFNLKRLIKNSAVVFSGTVLANGINILASPVLTRYYDPESFGQLSIFISITSILVIPSTLRYETAIPLEKKDKSALTLFYLSFTVLFFTSILLHLFFSINLETLNSYFSLEQSSALKYVALGILFVGLNQSLHYWYTRNEKFGWLSVSKTFGALSMSGFQVIAGLLSIGYLGLIWGYIIGKVVSVISLTFKSKIRLLKLKFSNVLSIAKEHHRFPYYAMPASLVTSLGTQTIPILLSSIYSVDIAGYFALASRVMTLPVQLIGQAVSQVFYSSLSKNTDGDLKGRNDFIIRIFTILLSISIPIFLTILFHGEEIFAFVFGDEWFVAGRYAQYLSLWLMISFASSPLYIAIIYVSSQQKKGLVISTSEAVLRLLALYIGFIYFDDSTSILLYSVAGILISISFTFWMFKISKIRFREIFLSIKRTLFVYVLLITIVVIWSPDFFEFIAILIPAALFDLIKYKSILRAN